MHRNSSLTVSFLFYFETKNVLIPSIQPDDIGLILFNHQRRKRRYGDAIFTLCEAYRHFQSVKRVSIATSTVSHHMEQMKESGLITEEPVKNSKFYGLSKQRAKELLDEIAKDLEIE